MDFPKDGSERVGVQVMEEVAGDGDTEDLRGEWQRRSVSGGESRAAHATSRRQHGCRPVDPDDQSRGVHQPAVCLAIADPDVEEWASR
jgi:hypothetical protein